MEQTQLLELQKQARERLENWDLLSMPEEVQVELVRRHVCDKLVEVSKHNDITQEIYVVDALYAVVSEALASPVLPADFQLAAPDGSELDRDKLEEDFKAYCGTLQLRPTSLENLIKPEASEFDQFIVFLTAVGKRRNFIDYWDNSIKLSETLRQNGVPIAPTYDQRELLYLIMEAFKCTTKAEMEQQMSQRNIEMATQAQARFQLGDK